MSNLDINSSIHSIDALPSTANPFRRMNRPMTLKLNSSTSATNSASKTDDLQKMIERADVKVNALERDLPTVPFRDEDFSVMGLLGVGAGGSVVKVLHNPSGMILARKTINGAFGDSNEESKIRKNVIREVQLMKTCRSPHIVSFYGAHFHDGDVILLMEYLDLGSLDSIYKKTGCIDQEIAGIIFISVLKGLDYLWTEKKVVHRDIKPSNVLVNSCGDIKIGDFGVSKHDNSSTNGGTFTGTQAYLAPERITNIGKITVAADLWALGLSMIEICTGNPPYSDFNLSNAGIMDLFEIIINEPSPSMPLHIDNDLSKVVSICLSKTPCDRSTPAILLNSKLAITAISKENEHMLTKWAISIFNLMCIT